MTKIDLRLSSLTESRLSVVYFLSRNSSVCLQRFAQSPVLARVIVSMRGINRQPVFGCVRSAFRMRAFAPPIVITHRIEELRGCGARAAKRIQRRAYGAIVIVQTRGKRILIVALNQWIILDQQPAQSDCAGGFAVCEVVDNFGC